MSDYLWDKTGEAEEDVERLEELLGQLRFQPRTFEVPATLPVVVRRAPRTLNTFTWSRLAIAASLLLTLLAGAWLITTKQRTTSIAPSQVAQQVAPRTVTTAEQEQKQPTQTATTATQPNEDNLASLSSEGATSGRKDQTERRVVERVNAGNTIRRQRREFISVAVVKRRGGLPRQLNEREVSAPHEEAATMTPREREAMEKFMLAMKVTSEKLGYAERQVQGLNESSPQR